jgi:hypothetical protein
MSVLRSSSRGDMYVEVVVETPVHLTKRQQELLREFDKAGDSQRTHPESEGFFARVKEFFEDLRESRARRWAARAFFCDPLGYPPSGGSPRCDLRHTFLHSLR